MVLLEDLNGHIEQDRLGIKRVIGTFSIGGRNVSGDSVIYLCVQNNMSIMNTFDHGENHRWMWNRCNYTRQRYEEKSMIDMMLTSDKQQKTVQGTIRIERL